ncbi:DUF1345 domain-containing protein [Georgenia yuyongxinii]|uniref:DUF1345 domain-containing protein n=1 Tax=Georgenia yuyongxinii TaxID=2589797 RepID=UPI001CB740EE|nr:DUF1345 domain-containing protein [Georgenia yuyongxinii]
MHRGRRTEGESRWGAAAAVAAAAGLHLALPDRLTSGPRWIVPALEVALLVGLLLANPTRLTRESRDARALSLALVGVIAAANAVSLVAITRLLLAGGRANGRELIVAAVGVWLTNVVVFALVLWEIDQGGPHARSVGRDRPPELLFPQMSMGQTDWTPTFADYLYISFTNSTAFSPTDTLPLSRRVKMAMLAQELLSFVTVGLVVARAVNILA